MGPCLTGHGLPTPRWLSVFGVLRTGRERERERAKSDLKSASHLVNLNLDGAIFGDRRDPGRKESEKG